ncbi:P-loop NTPase fold protein [Clostridium scatologenes]|uniref:KAP family P-loop domain protein n=1 Tax=Clostridium scatologenes TaxID=1548 RepID=A0A0E3GQL1_CLOSL|nr:P-loop NTPase fold protein [Clostridium scatologenes]AKA68761.1 KAP family P-loop domain protein [Clostridium scatologenes]
MNTLEATSALDRIFNKWSMHSSKKTSVFIDGAWGIGKTYFIHNYFSKNENEFIYTSVFGKNSVRDIEKSILIHSIPGLKKLNEDSGFAKATQKILSDLSDKFLGVSIDSYLNSFSIDDIKLDIVGNKRKIICFDDIERKSDSIEMKSLLGLIERASKNFDILIIGNTDKIDEKDVETLNKYKEKVIDYLIRIDNIDKNTLVFILKNMGIEDRDEIINVYLNNNISFGKAASGKKTFLINRIHNLRVFIKYVELIMRLEKYLEPYKADEDVLIICKAVIYDHYFRNKNENKNSMNYDKYNIYKTINKVIGNEEIKKDEFKEYFVYNSEIRDDIRSIYNAYRLSEREFESLIKKIKIKIKDKSLEYFIRQENVISIVNALYEIKIIDNDTLKKLFEIALDLYSPEKYIVYTAIDYSLWNNIDYSGNEIECDDNIKLFIEEINQKCSEKFQNFINNKLQEAKNSKNYEELLKLYNLNGINRIEDFECIFDYYFNQLVENYSDEISNKISTLISKADSELISNFFRNRIKNETKITKIKKYEQFDLELDRKMQYEAEQEFYTIDIQETE